MSASGSEQPSFHLGHAKQLFLITLLTKQFIVRQSLARVLQESTPYVKLFIQITSRVSFIYHERDCGGLQYAGPEKVMCLIDHEAYNNLTSN